MAVDYGRLRTVFFSEATDQLDRLNQSVLALEEDPASNIHLDEIFRLAHSLKGSASSFGFSSITTLTHHLESYLLCIRKGDIDVDTEAVDTLLAALDALRVLIDHEARLGIADSPDTEEQRLLEARRVVQRLSNATEHASRQGRRERRKKAQLKFPPAEAVEQARELVEQGRDVYTIIVEFEEGVKMAGMRAYLLFSNIERSASVIAACPERDEIDDHGFQGEIRLLVVIDEDAFEKDVIEACNIDQVESVSLVPFQENPGQSFPEDDSSSAADADSRAVGSPGVPEAPAPGELPGGGAAPAPGDEKNPDETDASDQRIAQLLGMGHDRFLRINIEKVDSLLYLSSELTTVRNKVHLFYQKVRGQLKKRELRQFEELLDKQDQLLNHLRDDIMGIRMVPVGRLFQRFPRLVRDLAKVQGKRVVFDMIGEKTELDKKLVDSLVDPLVHLLRNAVDHGLETPAERRAGGKDETGRLTLSASHQGSAIRIQISDDGRGVDIEKVRSRVKELGVISETEADAVSEERLLSFLFNTGFSTRDKVTEVSGRGIGLDVVKREVEGLNGVVMMSSRPGGGTSVTIQLPLTLALTNALLVEVCGEIYALPVRYVIGTHELKNDSTLTVAGDGIFVEISGKPLPVFDLAKILYVPGCAQRLRPDPMLLVQVAFRDKEALLVVDRFVGQEEMVIKSLAEHFRDVEGISGATLLEDGRVVLILDVPVVVGHHLHLPGEGRVVLQ